MIAGARPRLFAALCAAAALAGVLYALATPIPLLRWFAVAFSLFVAVAGAGAWLLERAAGPTPAGVRVEVVRRGGADEPAFVFPITWSRMAFSGVVALAAAPPLVFFAFFGDRLGLQYAALVRTLALVALCVLVVIQVLFAFVAIRSRGSYLALVHDGILWRTRLGSSFVPWDAIERSGTFWTRGRPVLGVRVSDRGRVEARGQLMTLNRRLFGYDLGYPLRIVRVPPDLLVRAFSRYVASPDARAAIGTSAELATLRGAP